MPDTLYEITKIARCDGYFNGRHRLIGCIGTFTPCDKNRGYPTPSNYRKGHFTVKWSYYQGDESLTIGAHLFLIAVQLKELKS